MPQDSKYTFPSGVLKNRFGITDAKVLAIQEQIYSDSRAAELVLSLKPIVVPTFDLVYLQKIHKHLFQDVYIWAGELRDVNIYKGSSRFCDCRFIVSEANKIFGKLMNDNYLQGLVKPHFVKKIAYYLSEINALHPFREGNGRTQRIFITELAKAAGCSLSFAKVSQNDMIKASIEAWKGNYKPFEDIFNEILTPEKLDQQKSFEL